MHSHITRSQARSLLGFKRYRLTAQLHVTPRELEIIERQGLDRFEVFADPVREHLLANSAAAHDRAKSRGIFVTRARDTAAITGAEIAALVSAMRALLAFKINVADLLRGVTIEHTSLRSIGEIELVLTECIDHIEHVVQSGRAYADATEDVFAPDVDEDNTAPAATWTRARRR